MGLRHEMSFQASNASGDTYTLDVFVNMINVSTFGAPHAEAEGLRQLRTRDGQTVNRLGKGRYKIVLTDEILTSDDPDAP